MEMIQFDEHIFQMGWFNHQLENGFIPYPSGIIFRLILHKDVGIVSIHRMK